MHELEELSQVQRQFVSDVSHELRTPLTTIRMAADLLFESRDQLDQSAARSAELLQSQLGRFESLLADLLEISRYDANAATLEAELVDICDVVRQSADVAQHLAERRGARIEFRLPAEPCLAEMDRRRVERILRNLLCNAVEHGEGRDVVVTSAADRDAVAVVVRDFGVGLAPGEEHLVFDRFWRADPARARTTGGTGLGLAIAKEDAMLHGGWLEAWGEPARGSVFRLTLPRETGAELLGSPLPLVPDQADFGSLAADPAADLPGPADYGPPEPGQEHVMRDRLRLVGGALVLSLAVTACASLPTSGIVRNTSLQGSGAQAQPGVQVVPVPPGRNWGQIDIVMGFLAASASFDDDYAVARKYLTTGLSRWWHPGVAATVIDSPNPSEEQPPRGLVSSGPPAGRVSVTGRHFAELQTGGPHQAGSIVASPGSSTYHFSLIDKAGVWRIDGISVGSKPASPSLLVLTSTDFERDYQARNLYFFRPGPAANTLVPDPVYIPQLPGDAGLKILVNTLLPSKRAAASPWPPSSSWLYQAATTAFPRGTKLISVNIIGGAEAVVKLGGTAVRTSPSQRMRMEAQLWWSLTASPYGTQSGSQIRSVVLEINHHSLAPTAAEFRKWLPRGVAAPLYYQLPATTAGPAEAILRAGSSQQVQVSLPDALRGAPFTAMAVSTPPTGFAVLAGCKGKDVYLMPQSRAGEIVTRRLPAGECTSLSWDIFGNLWVAATKGLYEISAGCPPLA